MRPRADQVHFAAQHVDELRQLVEPETAQPLSDARDAIAVVARPFGGRPLRRPHRAEFEQPQRPAAQSDAMLHEEDRARRIELDGQRDQREERRQQDKANERDAQAQRMPEGEIHMALPEVRRRDQIVRRQRFDRDLSGEPLVEADPVFNGDTLHAGLHELAHRQPAAPVGQRDHDPIGARPVDDAPESTASRRQRAATKRRLVAAASSTMPITCGRPHAPPHLDDDVPRQRRRADDQRPLPERDRRGRSRRGLVRRRQKQQR